MLRLVLDAIQTLKITDHPLGFLDNAEWISEARLESPFKPRSRKDRLGEGYTNADGVIGHYEVERNSKAKIQLKKDARQLSVVEAKMFSPLSSGTKNAPKHNQAARNIACMAQTLCNGKIKPEALKSVGFYVIAPNHDKKGRSLGEKIQPFLERESILNAIDQRIVGYESVSESEQNKLRIWEQNHFRPLVEHLCQHQSIKHLTWEECIESIRKKNSAIGNEIDRFYQACRNFN